MSEFRLGQLESNIKRLDYQIATQQRIVVSFVGGLVVYGLFAQLLWDGTAKQIITTLGVPYWSLLGVVFYLFFSTLSMQILNLLRDHATQMESIWFGNRGVNYHIGYIRAAIEGLLLPLAPLILLGFYLTDYQEMRNRVDV